MREAKTWDQIVRDWGVRVSNYSVEETKGLIRSTINASDDAFETYSLLVILKFR